MSNQISNHDSIIVQKYGGATVSDPEKIRMVAKRLSELSKQGIKLVAVVSAMGKTTNQLIELAHQVSTHPNRRELDMLLSTGERVSMALLSIALNDLGCPAISFTGSQAGILTDDSHVAANVIDINAPRVKDALEQNKVVVLAGFQGVSPKTKEITTLGRGGSDITAIAMASHLKATRCEILKDVDSVFTADPKIIPNAKPIPELTYEQLLEMTFWGAKFLNYRSVELAQQKNVPLYIGPAANPKAKGTIINADIQNETKNQNNILAINFHEQVIKIQGPNLTEQKLNSILEKKEIPPPQFLYIEKEKNVATAYLTAPTEQVTSIIEILKKQNEIRLTNDQLSSVTCTCFNLPSSTLQEKITKMLKQNKISIENTLKTQKSFTAFVPQQQRQQVIQILHSLIEH